MPLEALAPIDPRRLKLAGELGRRIHLTIEGNLLQLDLDRDFLDPFTRRQSGGVADESRDFIGIGKTLEGIVQLAAFTRNPALVERKIHVVQALLKSQEADGYIGLFSPEKRNWTLWDLHEQAFIIEALLKEAQLFDNQAALTTALRLANYIIQKWPGQPTDWASDRISGYVGKFLAEIGLNHAFISLHEISRDERYLNFAATELRVEEFDLPIVLGRFPPIEGHSYAYLSHCLAQLDLNHFRPNSKLLQPTCRAVDFMTKQDGMLITGGVGKCECWTNDQDGSGDLGETCSTAYQTFVFDRLLRLDGQSRWADLIERMLYNAAFAAQSPDGRQLRYYSPFTGPRVYFSQDTYCCPGNFRRLIGFLPQLVYYRTPNGIAVSLYTESEVTLDQIVGTTVTLRQQTDYPTSGRVTIEVDPQQPSAFSLLLRIPAWCQQPQVAINNEPVPAVGGAFLKLHRTWQTGDKITLEFPMPWRLIAGRKSESGRAALMRGPLVYTLNSNSHPDLAGLDLRRLVLLPETAELVADNSARPNGTACKIKADADSPGSGKFSLTLTEFPDPNGQWTYFQVPAMDTPVPDELLGWEKLKPASR